MRPIYFSAVILILGGFLGRGWGDPLQSLGVGTSPRGVATGQVLHPNETDFLVANFGSPTFIGQNTPVSLTQPDSSSVQVFAPSASGLVLSASIPTAAGARGLAAFDLDGSGIDSVLVTDYDARLLQVFKWKGGRFQKTAEVPTLSQPVGLAVGSTRSSGGGILFAAVADYGADRLSLFPLVNGLVGNRVDIPVSGNPVQAAVGDLDGSGENTIAVADLTSDKIDLLKRPLAAAPADLFAYQVTQTLALPPGSAPSALAAVDLNGDGKTDLVVADFGSSQLSVFLQQKDGTLEPLPAFATSGLHPNGLTVADLRGDGQKEIVVANRDSDTLDIFEWVNGTFRILQTLSVASGAVSSFGPVEVAALDTRHQGFLDLAVSHMRSNSVQVVAQSLTLSGGAGPTPTATPSGAAVTLTGPYFSRHHLRVSQSRHRGPGQV